LVANTVARPVGPAAGGGKLRKANEFKVTNSKTLFDEGADVNARSNSGGTPSYSAIRNNAPGAVEIMRLLRERGGRLVDCQMRRVTHRAKTD
jgi:ankyrin repeat protein